MRAPYRTAATREEEPPTPHPCPGYGARFNSWEYIATEALCFGLACAIIIVPAMLLCWLAIATCGPYVK
jgi:hypothetical protein